MRWLILAQLGYAIVAVLAFLLPFGRPRREIEWYLVCLNGALVALVALLFGAAGGIHISRVAGVVVLGALDAALTLQLVIFLRSRRRARSDDSGQESE